jgi:hypothetical protein
VNKIKDLFINHIEKLILLIFVCGGGFHMFNTLKPTEQSGQKEEIQKLVKQVKARHDNSIPPPMEVLPYFNQMRAPFMRVPRIEPAGSWRWYKIPEVTNTFSIREGNEKELRLSFVKDIHKIEITEGKEIVAVKVSASAILSLSVKALAPGKATIVIHSKSGTKETWKIEVKPKIVDAIVSKRLAHPPRKIDPVVERGSIRVFVLKNRQNEKPDLALPFVGTKIYRKVGAKGEWTEIYFEAAEKKNSDDQSPGDEGTEDQGNIPNLPDLPALGVVILKKDKKDKKKGGSGGGEDEAAPGAPQDIQVQKKEERGKGWVVFNDTEVKPDTTYIYAATTVARPVVDDEVLTEGSVESDQEKCVSKEIVSKSNLEIFLSGTFNNAASIYVKKYFNDTKFEKKLFSVPVGDIIGTARRMKVDGEYQQVDFTTGAILVDILKQVRDTTTEKRLIPVKDKNGLFVFKGGRMVRKEITVSTVSEHTKIVVLDTKGRIREYLKK